MGGRGKRVLYVTSVPLVDNSNGGSIVCREHVRRLSVASGGNLHVCFFAEENKIEATASFLDSVDALSHPVCFRNISPKKVPRTGGRIRRSVLKVHQSTRKVPQLARKFDPRLHWSIPGEATARGHNYTDIEFRKVAQIVQPDVIVVDYLMSALLVPSAYKRRTPVVTITLNRETEFHRENRKAGRLSPDVSSSLLAEWRMGNFERRIYRDSAAVVALSANDAPRYLEPGKVAIIEPTVGQSERTWSANRSRDLLYVGNIAHYPNFLAIKWIAEEFASFFATHAPTSSIRIIGADAQQVPDNWKRDNIAYLGASDRSSVLTNMASCGLFIAPIENDFGSKMKILECASFGTPILATKQALSGVPFPEVVPQFVLEEPEDAARKASSLLAGASALEELSVSLHRLYAEMDRSRPALWSKLLNRIVTHSAARSLNASGLA